MSERLVGYKLKRSDCGGWVHAGTSPAEVAEAVNNELDLDRGLPADERDSIVLEPYETTQEEIDSLPEFQGW